MSSSLSWEEHWSSLRKSIVSDLLQQHYAIVDNFLPNHSAHHYDCVMRLRRDQVMEREVSYMEDEETGQMTDILHSDPFYTVCLNPEKVEEVGCGEHADRKVDAQTLLDAVTRIGTFFRRVMSEDLLMQQESNSNEEIVNSYPFYNKIAVCEDFGNFLPCHFDNDGSDTRKLTIVYYTTPNVTRNWNGGDLKVFKPSPKLYSTPEFVQVEPQFNRAVIFYSDTVVHEVSATFPACTLLHDNKMTPPRTTITTWISCNDPSRINEDKLLQQRQWMKFFSQ